MNPRHQLSEKILRCIYNEMPENESNEFLDFLNENTSAMNEFIKFQETFDSIESIVYTPSDKLMNKVHTYARLNMITPQ